MADGSAADTTKRFGIVWVTLVVLTAHVALLSWAAAGPRLPAAASGARPAPHRWLLARSLASAPTAQDKASTAVLTASAGSPLKAPDRVPPPAPRPSAVAEPPTADIAATASAEAPTTAETRFYGYDEVDTPAEPQDDWAIDVRSLDALALSRIVVTLWVDERGSVLRCTVDEPARLSATERDTLADQIAKSLLRPARRGGAAVASKRRIELTTTGG